MNDALYVAASGMHAIQRMLETSAHNAVNTHTPGYQPRKVLLQNFGSFLDDVGNREHLVAGREVVAFEQGDLRKTESPFAVALEGDGFLAVRDGKGDVYYTRNGDFRLNAEGRLVTHAGYEVMAEGERAITVDGTGQVQIAKDGAVVQDGAEIARLQVWEFDGADRARLVPAAETLFKAPDGVGARPAESTVVHHGYLENPRYGGVQAMVSMLVASRNHDAMQRAIRAIDEAHENTIRSA